ncbi:hypothetical protein MOQ72_39420 [Saccharopolyspora sp. K220]|uniref:serine hydrolase n=1 Tax=Saccharopolyspora soli TaxID=2926618 RepID=UPI001F586A06|nr:serine hydrolase [Saccharopolyspora soli]MCI2423496.1 hypothetical protein [Saccharopolyspora soli]
MNFAKKAAAGLATATAGMLLAATPSYAAPISDDVTAAYVVVDVESGETALKHHEHDKFRSASLVKLLIAIDYLEALNGGEIPAEDRALLEPMLRSSNDDAASALWVRGGQKAIVDRMVAKIGLVDTAAPVDEGMWGYTALSASDVAKIYQYILHDAAPEVREFMLTNLHAHTKCADDKFDQSFGIPSAVDEPGAVKQGWSGFGAAPEPGKECKDSSDPQLSLKVLGSPEVRQAREIAPGEETTPQAADDIDLKRPAMHTSGTVGDDEKIIVLLTLEPEKTPWDTAAARTTALTEVLDRASS